MESLLYNLNIAAWCVLVWVGLMLVALVISAHIEGHKKVDPNDAWDALSADEKKKIIENTYPPPPRRAMRIEPVIWSSTGEVFYQMPEGYVYRAISGREVDVKTFMGYPADRVGLLIQLDHADEYAKKAYAEGVPLEDIFA